jgi:hypothetical protein
MLGTKDVSHGWLVLRGGNLDGSLTLAGCNADYSQRQCQLNINRRKSPPAAITEESG